MTATRPGGTPRASGRPTPRSGVPQPAPPSPSPASSLSWRAVVLTAVVALALAVLAPSVRAYLRQEEELTDLRGQVDSVQAEVDDLHGELARWDDPAYVVAQARERLAYVLPGEVAYRVVDPEFAVPDEPTATEPGTPVEAPPATRAWFATLLDSLVEAGEQ